MTEYRALKENGLTEYRVLKENGRLRRRSLEKFIENLKVQRNTKLLHLLFCLKIAVEEVEDLFKNRNYEKATNEDYLSLLMDLSSNLDDTKSKLIQEIRIVQKKIKSKEKSKYYKGHPTQDPNNN